MAAPSRGKRRNADIHRQEVSRNGRGHCRRQQSGAQCGARCRRETDYSGGAAAVGNERSEEHTSELQSLTDISYAVFCLKKKKIIEKNSNLITINIKNITIKKKKKK